ncbi:MAG: PilN domain-containing protein [Cyanobacteriota bacterium]|nr:PilN domain-containing protein [Cyanobacteriota bacterium]
MHAVQYNQAQQSVVTSGSWQSFDLLRRRRQELGLEAVKPAASKDLLIRGGLIAAGLLSLAGLIWLGMGLYARWLKAREDSLQPVAAQHQQVQSQLATLAEQLEKRTAANQALADGIASVAASSVLLAELTLLTPADVQLKTAVQQGQQLTLTGQAVPPNALRAINAFQLKLETSPLFTPTGVQVVKIVEQAGDAKGLSFEIKAATAPGARRANAALLQARGATGLLKRLQVLQQEGLLR